VEEDRGFVVFFFRFFPHAVFFLEINTEDKAQADRRCDDGHNGERIGACIGDGNIFAFVIQHI